MRLNPGLPSEALEDACRKVTRLEAPTLLERNRATHRMLLNDVTIANLLAYLAADVAAVGTVGRSRRPAAV